jgi:hypothetical protein
VSHLFADGRLAGVQRRLCSGKPAAPDNRGKHPEQFQIDIVQLDHLGPPGNGCIGNADMSI